MSVQHIKHWTNFLRFDFCCFALRGLCQWNSTVCWATAVREAKTKGAGEQKSKNKIRHLPPLRFSLSRSPTPYPTLCRILKTVNIYVPLSEFSCLKKRSSLLLDSDRSNLAPLRFRFGFYNSIVDLYFFVWLSVIFCERANFNVVYYINFPLMQIPLIICLLIIYTWNIPEAEVRVCFPVCSGETHGKTNR